MIVTGVVPNSEIIGANVSGTGSESEIIICNSAALDGDLSNGEDVFISTYNFGIVSEFALHYGSTGDVRSIFLPNIENVYSSNTLYDKFWTNNP